MSGNLAMRGVGSAKEGYCSVLPCPLACTLSCLPLVSLSPALIRTGGSLWLLPTSLAGGRSAGCCCWRVQIRVPFPGSVTRGPTLNSVCWAPSSQRYAPCLPSLQPFLFGHNLSSDTGTSDCPCIVVHLRTNLLLAPSFAACLPVRGHAEPRSVREARLQGPTNVL